MKKIIFILLPFALLFLLMPQKVNAIYDPSSVPNNTFGIHIVDENDLTDAANLVNSSGGDWGYIALVIQQNDMNKQKWQNTFDRARELHLIPIIRLATMADGNTWKKPKAEDAEKWAVFLNSLNWVTQNRYIILFNEPNHAQEWGGKVNPKEYVEILKTYSIAFKNASQNFFILNAGFDSSAPQEPPLFWDEQAFLTQMKKEDPNIFDYLDGWDSHSYPNPNFSGSPNSIGRNSIRNFSWEMNLLQKLAVKRNFPIFITETGWSDNIPEEKRANFWKEAFEKIWIDPKIIAVTPFLLNYQAPPFDVFSWRKKDSALFYKQYQETQDILKVKGKPRQLTLAKIASSFPAKLVQDSQYTINIKIDNIGESIWDKDFTFEVKGDGLNIEIDPSFDQSKIFVKPFSSIDLPVNIKTPKENSVYEIAVNLVHDGKKEMILNEKVEVVSPLKLNFKTRLILEQHPTGSDFMLKIQDPEDKHDIISFNNVKVDSGVAVIPEIHNLIPEKQYLFKLEKEYFLPKIVKQKLSIGQNTLAFGILMPFDQNPDNRFDLKDLLEIILHPIRTIKLFKVAQSKN